MEFNQVLVLLVLVASATAQIPRKCPTNQHWDASLNKCQECPANAVYNDSLQRCVARSDSDSRCTAGYHYDRTSLKCMDLDECNQKVDPCQLNEYCINTEGSYLCKERTNYCGQGFRFDKPSLDCKDIDECKENIHGCHSPYYCFNIDGSFECRPTCPADKSYYYNSACNQCQEGFYFNRTSAQCEDVDECLDGPYKITCQPYKQKCVTKPGLSTCVTHCSGGTMESDGQCYDINECISNRHNCSITQKCNNEFGTFECVDIHCKKNEELDVVNKECVCKSGFRLHIYRQECADIDECEEMPKVCGPHGRCSNKIGGYRCLCDQGYVDRNGTCQDIDECATMPGICGHLRCENAVGKFHCECPAGYRKNTEDMCDDIDECLENPDICHSGIFTENNDCFNLVGTFKCVNTNCPLGYRRLNVSDHIRKCELIDSRCSFKNQPGCFQQLSSQLIYEVIQITNEAEGSHVVGYVDIDPQQLNNYFIKMHVHRAVDPATMGNIDVSNAIMVTPTKDGEKLAFTVTRSLPPNAVIVIDVIVRSGSESLEKLYSIHQFHVFVTLMDW